MKIAVCFNGQIRTGIKASNSLLDFFGDLLPSIDFYVHTWDINSYRPALNLRMPAPPKKIISDADIRSFIDIYNPVNVIIESTDNFFNRISSRYGDTGDLVHIWHSGWYSNQLKIKFEELNRFTYDAVIRLRPDCIFPPDKHLSTDIEDLIKNPDVFYYQELHGDVYQMASSNTMNIAMDFYRTGEFYGNGFWPMTKFIEHLNSKQIIHKTMDDNRSTIFREEYSYLDPKVHYHHLAAINSFIFEDINYSKNAILETYRNLKNDNWQNDAISNLRTLFEIPESIDRYLGA